MNIQQDDNNTVAISIQSCMATLSLFGIRGDGKVDFVLVQFMRISIVLMKI